MGKQSKAREARRRQTNASGHDGNASSGSGDGSEAALLAALDLLSRRRAPYGDLLAAIVADTLTRFPVGDGGTPRALLEIGAGTGALRARLAPALAARAVHTDPSLSALARLHQGAVDAGRARVATAARAESLPFGDRAFGGVIGLCVFDAIHAGAGEAAAVAELARVLAPGGRFVHLLDMATLLDAPFAKVAAGGLVPIPNVFSDPADHLWPLDILLLRRDWLAGLLDLAARAGHPLATELDAFFTAFLAPPITSDAVAAADRFKALASSGDRRFALSSLIASACQLAVQQGYPTLQPLPFHSGRYLASVLETAFKESGAFEIELSDVVTRSAWRPREMVTAPAYRSLALGHERVLDALPARLLDETARAPAARAPDDTLVELGAYVFVARRV